MVDGVDICFVSIVIVRDCGFGVRVLSLQDLLRTRLLGGLLGVLLQGRLIVRAVVDVVRRVTGALGIQCIYINVVVPV
jgi:hypothetical protein